MSAKWIKITTDIFNDEKMFAIETQQDGFLMELVWFKILCLAGQCNKDGFLMINNKIAYTDEMISKVFRLEIGTIQRALQLFQTLEMIEVVDNTYMVSNWLLYQNEKGLEDYREKNRERQKRFRDKQKQILIGANSTCVYCGSEATGIDHIVATSKGGKDIESNTVPCCIDCNRIKNDKPLVDFLNSNPTMIRNDLVQNNSNLMKFVKWDDVTSRYVTLQSNVNRSISISYSNTISNIVNYLNNKLNSNYKSNTKNTIKHINARLDEGYTEEDFYTVIDKKVKEWENDPKMSAYLRPDTLFGTKFEGYLNQKAVTPKLRNDGSATVQDLADKWGVKR